LQSFLPLYLKLNPANFLELKEDFSAALLMVSAIVAQILIMKSQQIWGSRWFVPEKWRKNKNAYDYIRKISQQQIQDEEAD